ncbi:putative protein [Arabidopsis thaliana]|uniref:Transmembrane protein n=2 Tax=Arabidopsis thaliana TaxID=3702 RepID=A0A654FUI2_ARATH|nr:Putative membrane lipoprotein [Arabidopsis thaliana]AEE85849.1 Putative membrane lipoprotein [Arabidopsis thaliana]CAA0397085.1 unnamed protein product [Arabidopsis thaliana]CAA18190.1 putative protein [Arabidopsis thaliana]CAB79821.1 putative protein [Arabidopsis thaliana]VYS64496.1 unnamed protein product [Arabidopsis thaliana]|eukprot:NP_194832.1 Putative membrane lipoprotein [Arabidopsis thaliana]
MYTINKPTKEALSDMGFGPWNLGFGCMFTCEIVVIFFTTSKRIS